MKAIRRKYRAGVPFNRENLFVRDGYRCRYCGEQGTKATLTFDHVFPESRGGKDCWENAVTACRPCNNRKDNRTPHEAGMPFIDRGYRPHRPTVMEFFALKLKTEGIDGLLEELGMA